MKKKEGEILMHRIIKKSKNDFIIMNGLVAVFD